MQPGAHPLKNNTGCTCMRQSNPIYFVQQIPPKKHNEARNIMHYAFHVFKMNSYFNYSITYLRLLVFDV
jgi:hypothetical protein